MNVFQKQITINGKTLAQRSNDGEGWEYIKAKPKVELPPTQQQITINEFEKTMKTVKRMARGRTE